MTYTCCSTDSVRAEGAAEPGAAWTPFTAIASTKRTKAIPAAFMWGAYPGTLHDTPTISALIPVHLRFKGRRVGNAPIKTRERREMANPIPTGSDVRAGTYKCTNCGYDLDVQSVDSLPPCPSC